ncbi:HET-domain-containing protein [Thozetella sp. PMI_491]|nr:HET-domain-containing protein [Thozetella sp. PMI_491]
MACLSTSPPNSGDETPSHTSASTGSGLSEDESFPSQIEWHDTANDYPSLNASSQAGCEWCKMLREALLRRKIPHQGPVIIRGSYIYRPTSDHSDSEIEDEQDLDLTCFQCQVLDEQEYELAFVVFSMSGDKDRLCKWLNISGSFRTHLLHRKNVQWMQRLIDHCNDRDERPLGSFIPTRLLHVGANDGAEARLVITADALAEDATVNLDYACLSYCWGPKEDADRQLKTTRSTLESHCKHIDIERMTPLIRDAVTVCRTLGIEYIWIDALCILQGDIDDWSRESEMMASVYFYSRLTICPLASSSCLQGFLEPREAGVCLAFQSAKRITIRGHYTLHESFNDAEADDHLHGEAVLPAAFELDKCLSSWARRGWTLQEEEFSQRMLYFGRHRLHFSCRACNRQLSEDSFVNTRLYKSVFGKNNGDETWWREVMEIGHSESPSEEDRLKVREVWSLVIQDIHSRSLTNATDLFPSIAGFAKSCSRVLGDTYLAGLWRSNIHLDLLWKITDPPPGNLKSTLETRSQPKSTFIAPSWSWASQKHYLEHCAPMSLKLDMTESNAFQDFLRELGPGYEGYGARYTRPNHMQAMASLVRHHIVTEGGSAFGRVNEASITLLAKVVPIPSDILLRPRKDDRPPFGYLSDRTGYVYLDWSSTSRAPWYGERDPQDEKQFELHFKQLDWGKDLVEAAECRYCLDKEHYRNCWGIVIHESPFPEKSYRNAGVQRLALGIIQPAAISVEVHDAQAVQIIDSSVDIGLRQGAVQGIRVL